MFDMVFNMSEYGAGRDNTTERPRPRPGQVFEYLNLDVGHWQPAELPSALPCRLTTHHIGQPVMGNAVVDSRMPVDLPLPLELVPPEEAVETAPRIVQTGGYIIFSDCYVHKYPESNIANAIRQFGQLKNSELDKLKQEHGLVEVAEIAEFPEDDDDFAASNTTAGPTPAGPTPSPSTSVTSASYSAAMAPKTRAAQMREYLHEAEKVDRPLFRRQNPTHVYGQAEYGKRNFHAIMDDEYPIEYII